MEPYHFDKIPETRIQIIWMLCTIKKHPKNPLSSKSFKKHLEYYQLQNPVYLDQYSPELLQYAVKSEPDSVWQSIDDQATYTLIKNYIKKKKETIVSFYFFCLTIFPT